MMSLSITLYEYPSTTSTSWKWMLHFISHADLYISSRASSDPIETRNSSQVSKIFIFWTSKSALQRSHSFAPYTRHLLNLLLDKIQSRGVSLVNSPRLTSNLVPPFSSTSGSFCTPSPPFFYFLLRFHYYADIILL